MAEDLETRQLGEARKQADEEQRGPNLSELHHHVGKHVQESHDSVPQAAVRQALLVPGAGALGAERCVSLGQGRVQAPPRCRPGPALPVCTR